ncbi:MAG: hypothetical protein K2X81_16425, partial [Candidatus Obscuribacterales bacterium]|nr:hypothetical protein [Candidatus Obscuribacterales bacterium]
MDNPRQSKSLEQQSNLGERNRESGPLAEVNQYRQDLGSYSMPEKDGSKALQQFADLQIMDGNKVLSHEQKAEKGGKQEKKTEGSKDAKDENKDKSGSKGEVEKKVED